MLCLLQVRGRERRWVLLAGVMASLMFYARLNHLLWAPCLVLLLIPRDVDANWRRVAAASRTCHGRRWRCTSVCLRPRCSPS